MSRKAVLGRAMLSSLDAQNNEFVDSSSMSQTDSWKFIDNFVRQNFIPDTLDQLNDQIKLEPKLTLAGKENDTYLYLNFSIYRICFFWDSFSASYQD